MKRSIIGDKYQCSECGLTVVVENESCWDDEYCDIMCCGAPMEPLFLDEVGEAEENDEDDDAEREFSAKPGASPAKKTSKQIY